MLDNILQIVLGILTFVGIALLVILGIVLLVILLVMFVPIRYNGEFIKDTEHMLLRLKVTWLLRFVRAQIDYEKELLIRAFVLFFKVYDSSVPEKEKKVKKKKEKKTDVSLNAETSHSEENLTVQNIETDSATDVDVESGAETESELDLGSDDNSEEHTADANIEDRQSFFERIQNKIQNIICKCKSICDKIKSIVQNINYYIEILKEEETIALIGRCKERFFKVLKSICPRKLTADLTVGTGSPDTTGYIMAVAGMLYPTFGKSLNIVPDFDNTIFEGRIFLKGKVTIFVLFVQALKLYMDKELRSLLKRLKKEDS